MSPRRKAHAQRQAPLSSRLRLGRRAATAVAGLVAALAAGIGTATTAFGETPSHPDAPTFDRTLVDQGACGQTIRVNGVADIDGDARPDILTAGDSGVFWFDNRKLACHEVARGWYGEGSTIFGYDVDGDGRTDIVTGDARARHMVWFRNDGSGAWNEHRLTEDAYCHNVDFTDVNGDGRPDMACVDPDHATVSWLEAPASPTGLWQQHVLDRNRPAWGDAFADIDGDGRIDLVAGRGWYRNTGHDQGWPRYAYTNLEDTARPDDTWFGRHFDDYEYLTVGDLNGDGRPDVFANLFAGTPEGQVWAFLAPADPLRQPWKAVEVDAGPLYSVHSLDTGDFDGSGRPQVMVGEMDIGGYGFGSNPDPKLLLYRLDGNPATPDGWTRIVLDHTGTHEARTVDFDLDGRPDIVGGDENSDLAHPPHPGKLVIWRNTTATGEAAPTTTTATTSNAAATDVRYENGDSFALYGAGDDRKVTVPKAADGVLVFVFAGKAGGDELDTVAYGGRPLRKLAVRDQHSVHLELRYLVDPPAGTGTLEWSKTGRRENLTWGYAVYSGVDQDDPFGKAVQGGETDAPSGPKSVDVSAPPTERILTAFALNGDRAAGGGPRADADLAQRWADGIATTGGGLADGPGGSGATAGWSPPKLGGGRFDWAQIAVPLRPAP
jgi:hypothetical protein